MLGKPPEVGNSMKGLQEKHMEKIYGNLRVPAQYHLTPPIPPHPPKQRRLLTYLCPLIRPNPYFLPRNGQGLHQLLMLGKSTHPTFHEGSLLKNGAHIKPLRHWWKKHSNEVRPPWLPASASSVDSWHSSCGSASAAPPAEPNGVWWSGAARDGFLEGIDLNLYTIHGHGTIVDLATWMVDFYGKSREIYHDHGCYGKENLIGHTPWSTPQFQIINC